jgi:exodeoxyribonuclease X
VPIVGGKIGESRSWLVRPERSIKYFATRVHGLTNDDVADQPPFATVADECPEVHDTLKLTRRLFPTQPGYKLGMLARTFTLAEGVADDLAPHRATYDVLVTARLFVHLATASGGEPLTLEELRNKPVQGSDHEASALF